MIFVKFLHKFWLSEKWKEEIFSSYNQIFESRSKPAQMDFHFYFTSLGNECTRNIYVDSGKKMEGGIAVTSLFANSENDDYAQESTKKAKIFSAANPQIVHKKRAVIKTQGFMVQKKIEIISK